MSIDQVDSRQTGRYLVVSSDAHAGPSLERSLRPYCPKEHLGDFDEFVKAYRAGTADTDYITSSVILNATPLGVWQDESGDTTSESGDGGIDAQTKARFAAMVEAAKRTADLESHDDPAARLRDMDSDGVAAEIVFAGGGNREVLPFIGFGADIGSEKVAGELRAVGCGIWNRWLADYVAAAPARLIGVMQIPIWDIEAAIREMRAGKEAGIGAVNFPAPRSDFPAYNDEVYEPFWSACEDLELPLVTHAGGGEIPLGFYNPGGAAIHAVESAWLSRRALWEMVFGRVFERHPGLRVTFTEQRMVWVPSALADMDYINKVRLLGLRHTPSETFALHCFVAGSYLAPWEVAERHGVGIDNLLWGTDYPHVEGTFPHTRAALRNSFWNVPEDETRKILGENALRAYYLDEASLRAVAERVGPTVAELQQQLRPDEVPAFGGAFREAGTFDASPL